MQCFKFKKNQDLLQEKYLQEKESIHGNRGVDKNLILGCILIFFKLKYLNQEI